MGEHDIASISENMQVYVTINNCYITELHNIAAYTLQAQKILLGVG
jgi:hypothetical protein